MSSGAKETATASPSTVRAPPSPDSAGTTFAALNRAPSVAALHMPRLDGLRCSAAVAVVAHHVFLGRYLRDGTNGIGVYAVWLFFTLSGFLITGILLRARDSEASRPVVLRAFYARRFLHIMPVYCVMRLVGPYLAMGRSFRSDLGWPAHT